MIITKPVPGLLFANILFLSYNSSGRDSVDGCDCAEILALIEAGKINTTPLITHRYKLEDIEDAYHLFENRLDNVIKIAVTP